jgi:hypothetical protein
MLDWTIDHPRMLFVVMTLFLLASVEIGFGLRRRRTSSSDEQQFKRIGETRNEIGVLLSLLLGFTLAMSLVRYDHRTELVVDEANAIGTTRLRAEMLPEPSRARVRELLRQYIDSRVQYSRAGPPEERQQPLRRSQEIQSELWQEARAAAQQSPNPISSLFVASLNEAFDLREKRFAALENRIPGSIWFMLVTIAVLTCLTVGYAHTSRLSYSMVVPPLMIAIVMMLIADLDTSRSGLIRVRQHSIERLQSESK